MQKKLAKGFTLIELMIVVAIIGILAAIAIPNFIRYQLKSKQSEAKTVMGGIKTSLESFRSEFDNYPNPPSTPGAALTSTKRPWGAAACGGGCQRLCVAGGCCDASYDCISYRPTGDVYFNYNTDPGVVAGGGVSQMTEAEADLDQDGTNSAFVYCLDEDQNGNCDVANTFGCPLAPIRPAELHVCDTENY